MSKTNWPTIAEEQLKYHFMESAEKAAKGCNCDILIPKSNQLFLDIDNKKQQETFNRRIGEINSILTNNCIEFQVEFLPSRSGKPHQHIVITLTQEGAPYPISDWQRLAMQFMLGSDPIRETLSVYRALDGVNNPSILFRPKLEG